jgi:hypothetical protein
MCDWMLFGRFAICWVSRTFGVILLFVLILPELIRIISLIVFLDSNLFGKIAFAVVKLQD